jgi:hypothetical protein
MAILCGELGIVQAMLAAVVDLDRLYEEPRLWSAPIRRELETRDVTLQARMPA